MDSRLAILHKGEYILTQAAAAELMVALTSASDKKAMVAAALFRNALSNVSEKYQKQIEEVWSQANKEAVSHLSLVLKNNPQKDRETLLKRPDIESALLAPYEQAAAKSKSILLEAWNSGEAEAVKQTKAEFKLLGENWEGHDTDSKLLTALLGDLAANAKGMRKRYHDALLADSSQSEDDRLNTIANDVRRRASYSVSQSVWGVASQVKDSAFAKAGLNKMWWSMRDGKTCSHCKGLHGMVRGPGELFPLTVGSGKLKAYLGVLIGPPRHPRCRCVLVATKLKKTK